MDNYLVQRSNKNMCRAKNQDGRHFRSENQFLFCRIYNFNFCAWEVLQLLKRTSRAFHSIFYFCPSSNSLGDIALQRSRTGAARPKKSRKKGPHTLNPKKFRFLQNGDPHYFLILGGVSIQQKAVKCTVSKK